MTKFLISQAHRDAAYNWNPAWGQQRPDQHVRDYLKANDAAVMGSIIDSMIQAQYEADRDAEMARLHAKRDAALDRYRNAPTDAEADEAYFEAADCEYALDQFREGFR